MRVLIVRLGAFGDIIHTLPLASDLFRAGANIDWVCDQHWSVLFEDNPIIDRYFTISRKKWKNTKAFFNGDLLNAARLLRRELRERRYDLVIDAQGRAKSSLIAFLSGARGRISHCWPTASEGSSLMSQRRMPNNQEHIVDQMRNLGLLALGKSHPMGSWSFPLPDWKAEKTFAAEYLKQQQIKKFWIWNVGATWPTKLWPMSLQAKLLTLLCDRGHEIMICWGPGLEEGHARKLCADEPRAHLAPATTLPQLAGFISRAEILLSCDTGPLHLAMAMQKPAVGLFGPVPAGRNGPRGPGYRNIQAPGALWERRDVSKVHMDAISPKQVYNEALAALAERGF
jgi:heptosyltransferase-1